ncbi:MAG TPA: hypothetical protein VMV41_01215 [Cellulomonadaceae bacterium]|nr:hypothetical protein [Cellulomonadaceae bacterium]
MTAPVDLTRAPDPSEAILATVADFRANERAGDCDYGDNLLAFLDRVRDLQDRKDGVS